MIHHDERVRPLRSVSHGAILLATISVLPGAVMGQQATANEDAQVLPICDQGGRIRGLVSADVLLRALSSALAKREADSDGS